MTLKECIEFLEDEKNYCDLNHDQWFIDSYAECIAHLENLQELQ